MTTFDFKFYFITCEFTKWPLMKILLLMKAKEVLGLRTRITNLAKFFDKELLLLLIKIFNNNNN